MKPINELVSEAAKKYIECPHEGVDAQYCLCACHEEYSFVDGATFTTNLVWERVVEALKEFGGSTDLDYNTASDWLEANRSTILGTTKTSEGE